MPTQTQSQKTFCKYVLLSLCALSMAGCLRPYRNSVFDPPTAQFPGIISQWGGTSGSNIRVLFVHGMCSHTEANWITAGWDVVIKGYFPAETMTEAAHSTVGQVQIVDHDYQIGPNKLAGRFLIWSPLTTADKARLNFDNPPGYSGPPIFTGGQFTWKRATLNSDLKSSLLNDCLSDAIIYAGYRGADIQTSMQNAICAALDGTSTNNTCVFPATYGHGSRKIAIVTESLGSRMVFDAISALKLEAQGRSPAALAAFDEAVSPITQIYMLANQLPLFALARPAPAPAVAGLDVSASPTPSMTTALGVLSEARARHRAKQSLDAQRSMVEAPLSLVAFSDPNDLLSYRIPPNDTAIVGNGTTVVNVITSNADSYFGYVENPYPAHTAYNQNPDAVRLLFGGSIKE
ncbi:MAG: hypothetical protein ABSF94_17525 [Steroidobacteraceae bacterium]|jgi:hypothetical protein